MGPITMRDWTAKEYEEDTERMFDQTPHSTTGTVIAVMLVLIPTGFVLAGIWAFLGSIFGWY